MIITDKSRLQEMEQYLKDLKDKPLFCDIHGRLVNSHDDERIIWFSAKCTFWTDDWNKLKKVGINAVSVCPNCQTQGLQCKYKDWMISVKKVGGRLPNYEKFIAYTKEKCITTNDGKPVPTKFVYERWNAQLDKGVKSLDNALSDGINNILDG